MKQTIKFSEAMRDIAIALLTAAIVFGFAACPNGNDKGGGTPTPVATDFNYDNMNQMAGDVTDVSITPKKGKSNGNLTIYYTGTGNTAYAKSETVPQGAGDYAVTFDVAAAKGWKAAEGLSAGSLTVNSNPNNPTPAVGDYDIIKNLEQWGGYVTAVVTITAKDGKSNGARTIWYQGTSGTNYNKSETIPQAAGTYSVTFDVAAAKGWNPATGLSVGNLIVKAFPLAKGDFYGTWKVMEGTYAGETIDIKSDEFGETAPGNSYKMSIVTWTPVLPLEDDGFSATHPYGYWVSGKITEKNTTWPGIPAVGSDHGLRLFMSEDKQNITLYAQIYVKQ
jgi:hypothetical protein